MQKQRNFELCWGSGGGVQRLSAERQLAYKSSVTLPVDTHVVLKRGRVSGVLYNKALRIHNSKLRIKLVFYSYCQSFLQAID
jgi:hypothetical protein